MTKGYFKKTGFISILLYSFLAINLSCKTQKKPNQSTSKEAESQGVYQFLSDDSDKRYIPNGKKGVFAKNAMVAATHPIASQIGLEILQEGGNAIDAAVGVSFALAVVHPAAGNIGGGGFLVYRDKNGENFCLDYREKASEMASKDMYLDPAGNVRAGASAKGHLSVGVPGAVDGLVSMHQKFGKMAWAKIVAKAIKLAKEGIILTEKEARSLNRVKPEIIEENIGKSYFLKKDWVDWNSGDTLIQLDLAKTLQRIADNGRDGFYKGETAALLLKELNKGCGIITQTDLDQYKSEWRKPTIGYYRGHKIIGMPPPSSGGIALNQLLKYVEPYPIGKYGWHSDSASHVIIEAERRAFADRAKWLGDPDFVKVPTHALLNNDYLTNRWANFSFNKANTSKEIQPGEVSPYESLETTHFSIVDADGNAVAITTTLNNSYGSKVVVDGAGFLLNDEMDDFSIKPGTPNLYGLIGYENNAIAPGKRMLSSMTPTIVEKNGKLNMVLGTPGGSTIITSVFQVLTNVIDYGMSMQEAVDALRFHHQWLPDKIVYETGAFDEKILEKLSKKGFNMEMQKNTIGRMDCILVYPNGQLEGAGDTRGDDSAKGY